MTRFLTSRRLAAAVLVLGAGLGLLPLAASAPDPVLAAFDAHLQAHPSGEAPFTWPRQAYEALTPAERARLPIGVFDSGIGGLTVLEALLTTDAFNNATLEPGADGRPDFANERFIYLGDQANMPYGNYPSSGREDFLRELVVKDAAFLLGRRYHTRGPDGTFVLRQDKPLVKAIVIACNTATAYGLGAIREEVRRWGIPIIVVGVVEAGARGLIQSPGSGAVGVMATVGTCASEVYPRTIARAFEVEGRKLPAVAQSGSARLAGVIEGDPAFATPLAQQIAEDARAMVKAHREKVGTGGAPPQPLEKIMLGCTHFPLVAAELDAAFEALRAEADLAPWIAPRRVFINPAEWTAKELFRGLTAGQLHRPAGRGDPANHGFFLSVANDAWPGVKLSAPGVLDPAYKYGRQAGNLQTEDTVVVPMTRTGLPAVSRQLLQDRLPAVWRQLPES